MIFGGKGSLGSELVKYFKSKNWWKVISVDTKYNTDADDSIVIKHDQTLQDQLSTVESQINTVLQGYKLDAVLCVAGGWVGGNILSKEFLSDSEVMWKKNVWSSLIAASVASNHLKDGGIIVFTGSKAALEGTPNTIGYGVSKAAVHQLTKSLADKNSGLPPNSRSLAVLPLTIDTPSNRKWMPDADKSTWTPLKFIVELMYKWSIGEELPPNGSLVQIHTKGGETIAAVANHLLNGLL